MEILELLNMMTQLYIVIFIFLLIMKIDRYYKRYERQRRLEFTQKFILNNKENLERIQIHISKNLQVDSLESYLRPTDAYPGTEILEDDKSISDIYKILSFSNEVALGIKNELYDSDLLKSSYHHDLKIFYKLNYLEIDQLRSFSGFDMTLFHLESLLQEWEQQVYSRRKM